MSNRELVFNWEWTLRAERGRLWPLVSDTERLNRDAGLPPLVPPGKESYVGPGRKLAFRVFGLTIHWMEEPSQWSAPHGFSVLRRYINGPMLEMLMSLRLTDISGGGTRLQFQTTIHPRSFLWSLLLAPVFALVIRRNFNMFFRRCDQQAVKERDQGIRAECTFAFAGKSRLAARIRDLLAAGANPRLAGRLQILLATGDDRDLARMRPYAYARNWDENRRDVLELFLLATRAGVVNLRWDVLCPSCRGTKGGGSHLGDLRAEVHCDACRISFRTVLDRSVEVTFAPNPSIRSAPQDQYCVGGPQMTPHVLFRQHLSSGNPASLKLGLEVGQYLLRSLSRAGSLLVEVAEGGEREPRLKLAAGDWGCAPSPWHRDVSLSLSNGGSEQETLILERAAWRDDAVTASEVTAMQSFRDLFPEEALKYGEEISVGSLAFLFTDLKGSTQLYQEIGDAKAFALVMEHFEALKSVIAAEGGGVVKTIGDAVMAVFPHPQAALRAALAAHRIVEASLEPLVLKSGIHCGPCIAVNQNDRLDYFGSTLNLSARLLNFCQGGDVVITRTVAADPETSRWLLEHAFERVEDLRVPVRGFEKEAFALKRIPWTTVLEGRAVPAG